MARKRKQQPLLHINPNNPMELVAALILAVPLLLWYYIKTHPVQGVFIIAGIVTFVIWFIAYKKKKRAEYLRWFYDRTRRLNELNLNDYIDRNTTKAIEDAIKSGKAVAIGNETGSFRSLREAYHALSQAEDVVHTGDVLQLFTDATMSGQYGVVSKCSPLGFKYIGENNGGYAFYVFPETVLAFVEGPEKCVFLAAYYPEAISISYDEGYRQFSVVVQEKSQNHIRYYDKYKPVKDAEIMASQWQVTNKDGSRSFKGGLLPEHNPLIFKLRYGQLVLKFGGYSATTSFSNSRAVKAFVNEFKNCGRGGRSRASAGLGRSTVTDDAFVGTGPARTQSRGVEPRRQVERDTPRRDSIDRYPETRRTSTVDEDAAKDSTFSRTTAQAPREETVPSKPNQTSTRDDSHSSTPPNPTPNTASQQGTPEKKDGGLTEDQARTRNRDVAKATVDVLNKKYAGKYDFKTYQVRKPREGWGLQDAGVYTYVTDAAGNQFTIEFDMITNLSIPQTELRFSIWGKTKEMVAARYKTAVSKGMKVSGEGYGLVIKRDYESLSPASMAAAFEKDCLTLMKLIDIDDPV